MIVPRVMGQALGAHPLLVIFALVAGAELYGIIGALLSLPAARDGPRGRALPAPAHHARALAGEAATRAAGSMSRCRCGSSPSRPRPRERRCPADRLRGAGQAVRRAAGARTRRSRAARGRSTRAARPERRGQDDAAVVAGGLDRGQRGTRAAPGSARDRRRAAAPGALSPAQRAGEPRALRATRGRARSRRPSSRSWATATALGDALDRPVERLSLGQAQRVNVAIGLLGRPRVVLLDEPTAALDPGHRLALWSMLERVGERGGAVAFATQNVEEARLAADTVLVLVDGRAAYAGPQERVLERGGRRRAAAGTSARSLPSSSARGALLEEASRSCCARTCCCSRARGPCWPCSSSTRSCSRCSSAACWADRARGRAWRS